MLLALTLAEKTEIFFFNLELWQAGQTGFFRPCINNSKE
jgi:hypothetical protein